MQEHDTWEEYEADQDAVFARMHALTGQLPMNAIRAAFRRCRMALVPGGGFVAAGAENWLKLTAEHIAGPDSQDGPITERAKMALLQLTATEAGLVPIYVELPDTGKPQHQPKMEYVDVRDQHGDPIHIPAPNVIVNVQNPPLDVAGIEPVLRWVPVGGQNAPEPAFHYDGDVGFDLAIIVDATIDPGYVTDVPVGIRVQLPPGYWGLIIGRSSAERKLGVRVTTGVIDNGYTGPLFASMQTVGDLPITLKAGVKPAQMLLLPIPPRPTILRVPELGPTDRGTAGFGSTGGMV